MPRMCVRLLFRSTRHDSVLALLAPSLRSARVDENAGGVFAYGGSKCADAAGEKELSGSSQRSLPGYVHPTLLDSMNGRDLGFCCDDHRLRATQRYLVSMFCLTSLHFPSILVHCGDT